MIWTWIYVIQNIRSIMITKIYKALIIYCWLYRNYIAGWVAKFFASQVIFPQFVAWLVHLRSVDLPVNFGLRTPRLWDVFSMLKTDGPRLARESAVSSVGLQNWPYTRFQPRRPTLYSGAGGRKPDSNGHGDLLVCWGWGMKTVEIQCTNRLRR